MTFACFFVFTGNISRVPACQDLFSQALTSPRRVVLVVPLSGG